MFVLPSRPLLQAFLIHFFIFSFANVFISSDIWFEFFKANILKVLNKDFGNEFDDLLAGMFSNRISSNTKAINDALKVDVVSLTEIIRHKLFYHCGH